MFLLQKRGGRERFIQVTLGTLAAYYLRLVWKTSRFELEPANIYEKVEPDLPAILAMWHGQHFMAPFIKREAHRVTATARSTPSRRSGWESRRSEARAAVSIAKAASALSTKCSTRSRKAIASRSPRTCRRSRASWGSAS